MNSNKPHPKFTVYLRFPSNREGFRDPPICEWNQAKEQKLWQTLSKSANKTDIDWGQLAKEFSVSVPFILQQAAWLYEKELEQVRAQMQKVNMNTKPKSDSPTHREVTPIAPASSFSAVGSVSGSSSSNSRISQDDRLGKGHEEGSSSASFFGSTYGDRNISSRQLLSKSRNLAPNAIDEDVDADFLPLESRTPASNTSSSFADISREALEMDEP